MKSLSHLFDNNRAWSEGIREIKPDFFLELSRQQSPKYLWIGCSDSRVPANQIVGLAPGELFVHRNIANLVVHTDLNCLSVMQFAVDILKVRHIIVCGHYGCSGVGAAHRRDRLGLSDNWLRHVRDIGQKHEKLLASFPETEAVDRLCELNVLEQVGNVCCTTIVQDAWEQWAGIVGARLELWTPRRLAQGSGCDGEQCGRSGKGGREGDRGGAVGEER